MTTMPNTELEPAVFKTYHYPESCIPLLPFWNYGAGEPVHIEGEVLQTPQEYIR